jgi:hypothetical protein
MEPLERKRRQELLELLAPEGTSRSEASCRGYAATGEPSVRRLATAFSPRKVAIEPSD